MTSLPEIFIYINVDDFCKRIVERAFFTSAASNLPPEIMCSAMALHCLNNLSCGDNVIFENILLCRKNTPGFEHEMIEKFDILIGRGHALVTN